jgi:hypothetical protein
VIFSIQKSWLILACTSLLLWPTPGYAAVSTNLPLDDPAYPLLEKLVGSNLTFTNALTIKPITRLYVARLIAEAIQTRRHEWKASQRPDPFIDQTLQYLADRFKPELRQIGFFYQPRRPGPFVLNLLNELKLDLAGAHNQFVHRDSSGNLQGVFRLSEGFAYGNDFSMRLRSVSWGTFWQHLAAYLEPEIIVRSDPILGDRFDFNLHKGYLKAGYSNLELEFGRDTLWWGPASQGDLVLSNNAPPLELLKLSAPFPFRFPWVFRGLGEWQMSYFVARLEDNRTIPHALISGLRVTLQLTSYLKFGYTNVFQAFGEGGVSIDAPTYISKLFVPSLDANTDTINGLAAYDAVLSLPFVRRMTFLKGVKFYWQRGNDNVSNMRGILRGGNILGGVIDGGQWDLRVEFAETRDDGVVWYTHPTYRNGFSFKRFILGHPIGGAAESFFGRATYYLTPTTWIAVDGRHERYGLDLATGTTTQRRFGLEASYQLPLQQHPLILWSRFEHATLNPPSSDRQHAFILHFSARIRF